MQISPLVCGDAEASLPTIELTLVATLPSSPGSDASDVDVAALQDVLRQAMATPCHNVTSTLTALLPSLERDSWQREGETRLVLRRRLELPLVQGRLFEDLDLSFLSVTTLLVELFASFVGLSWGTYSTIMAG